MKFVVGLGNPGSEYEGTRHNVGFRVIEALKERLNIKMLSGRGDYQISFTTYQGNKVGIVKPMTYMNNSGLAVIDIIDRFKATPENILVVCDDFMLPLGIIRIRQRGTDGGHNGLYSIIYHLKDNNFARIRLGIAGKTMPRKKEEKNHYVLANFENNELETVEDMIMRGRNASLVFISDGLNAAMNKYNEKLMEK